VERAFEVTASRSVSSLAAPEFAAAMVQRRVVGTIPWGRQVLLVAEVPVAAGAVLLGATPGAAELSGEVRVLAVQGRGGVLDWSPDRVAPLAVGDRMTVLATRRGLARLLADSEPGPGEGGAEPGWVDGDVEPVVS
jgi:hypothetical protein